MKLEELFMNMKNNLIFFFSFFPVFAIKSNFSNLEYSITALFFIFLLFLNYYLIKNLNNKKFYQAFYLSLIFTIGIDNHLGLFSGLIQSNINFFFKFFEIIYIPAFLTLCLIFLVILMICIKSDINKITHIFFVTIAALFLFSIIDDTKSYKKIPFFEKKNNKRFDQSTLVLIWDEMSGLNSLSSKTSEGKIVDINFRELFDKYHFNLAYCS